MNHSVISFLFATLFVTLGAMLSACSSSSTLPPLESTIVIDHGFDAGGEFCRDFRMSDKQVKDYFRRAQEIDERALHDRYDHLPCYVRGTAMVAGQAVQWKIHAGATAIVTGAPNARFFGCDSCDDLFTPNSSP